MSPEPRSIVRKFALGAAAVLVIGAAAVLVIGAAAVAQSSGQPDQIVVAGAASEAVPFTETAPALSDAQRDALRPSPAPTTTTTTTTTTVAPPPTAPSTTTTTTPPPPPPTTMAPAPQEEGSAVSCGGWESLIASYFPNEVAKACRVMMCESKGNPGAQNPSSSASGLWQFLDGTWQSVTGTPGPASAYSAETQTAAAAKLRNSAGWSQWSCK